VKTKIELYFTAGMEVLVANRGGAWRRSNRNTVDEQDMARIGRLPLNCIAYVDNYGQATERYRI